MIFLFTKTSKQIVNHSFVLFRLMLLQQRRGWTFMILDIALNIHNFCWFCCGLCLMHLEPCKAKHCRYFLFVRHAMFLCCYFCAGIFFAFQIIVEPDLFLVYKWKRMKLYNCPSCAEIQSALLCHLSVVINKGYTSWSMRLYMLLQIYL
jgi:hypothetical protein